MYRQDRSEDLRYVMGPVVCPSQACGLAESLRPAFRQRGYSLGRWPGRRVQCQGLVASPDGEFCWHTIFCLEYLLDS